MLCRSTYFLAGCTERILRELFQPVARGARSTAQDQPHRTPRKRQRDRNAIYGRTPGTTTGHFHLSQVRPGKYEHVPSLIINLRYKRMRTKHQNESATWSVFDPTYVPHAIGKKNSTSTSICVVCHYSCTTAMCWSRRPGLQHAFLVCLFAYCRQTVPDIGSLGKVWSTGNFYSSEASF